MGSFIAFEGIDGSGKSTVCGKAAGILRSEGYDVATTFEPTDTGIGAFIRSDGAGVSQKAESLLFTADRWEHTAIIREMRASGKIVLCDRYYASTIAYQSAGLDGDSADRDWLEMLSSPFFSEPDAVILLDIDPEESLSRVYGRGEDESKFENLPFLKQVRSTYLDLAKKHHFHIIDASGSPDRVLEAVLEIIRGVV